jgi:hypothetical protein
LKCKVTVRAKAAAKTPATKPTKVKLNKTKVSLDIANTKKYQLKVTGTSKKATWKTSNAKVAAVSKAGDDYSHPIEAVICSGCRKEFKDEKTMKQIKADTLQKCQP